MYGDALTIADSHVTPPRQRQPATYTVGLDPFGTMRYDVRYERTIRGQQASRRVVVRFYLWEIGVLNGLKLKTQNPFTHPAPTPATGLNVKLKTGWA